MKYYYAFEYFGYKSTTTGEPNARTNRLSIAGTAKAFLNLRDRAEWIRNGYKRFPITLKELRRNKRGLSGVEFDEYIEHLRYVAKGE